MGNKRITEKDFWMCTTGAVPAQLQGTRLGQKKQSGEVYITEADKSTSSFIDFGCTKYMYLMAIIAAVAVVALAVVGVLTVATGGAALIALGMVAGAAGAVVGGVVGGLLCGQKMAKGREWTIVPRKHKTLFQGKTQVIGDFSMTCKAGGNITFAPNIKSWSQAIAMGASNYLKEVMKGAMTGGMIGMGGAAISGGATALAGGGLRGLGQAALQFVKSAPKAIGTNLFEGAFMDFGFKAIDVSTAVLDSYAEDGSASVSDALTGLKDSSLGDYDALKNIVTTGGTWDDWQAAIMLLAPGGKANRSSAPNASHGVDASTGSTKPNTPKPTDGGGETPAKKDTDSKPPPKTGPAKEPTPNNKKGESFEDGGNKKSRKEDIKRRLQEHANRAKNEAKLSIKQKASIQRSKQRAKNSKTTKEKTYHEMMASKKEKMYMGTQIDTKFKEFVDNDPNLSDLSTTGRGKFGPDVYDPKTKEYWDLTTEKDWNRGTHQKKYDDEYGDGDGIFWD